MAIAAGLLRHRVRFDELVPLLDSSGEEVQNGDGSIVRTWQEVTTVWAAIEPLSAREFIQSAATQSQVSARIVIRHRDGLNAAMRIVHVYNGRIYNIHGLLSDKESGLEYITIPVSEGTNDGE